MRSDIQEWTIPKMKAIFRGCVLEYVAPVLASSFAPMSLFVRFTAPAASVEKARFAWILVEGIVQSTPVAW